MSLRQEGIIIRIGLGEGWASNTGPRLTLRAGFEKSSEAGHGGNPGGLELDRRKLGLFAGLRCSLAGSHEHIILPPTEASREEA